MSAVSEDLDRLAAQQQSSQPTPAVRCHDDQVTIVLLCRFQDPFRRILVFRMNSGEMSALRASVLTPDRMRDAVSLVDFSYSSTGKPNAASPVTMAVQGSVTVTAVTFAPSDLARSKPAA